MATQDRFIYVPLALAFLFVIAAACVASADEPLVRFDVPALLPACEYGLGENHGVGSSTEKTIEVVIPVSTELAVNDRTSIHEFRFDVCWNRNVYPIVDYAPRTQTVSEIEGLISVEKDSEKNAGIGLGLSSSYLESVSGSAKADLSQRQGQRLKYQEVPQHEVLVASGTVQRGTGAFFRFHPSRRTTLEGGRDLIVVFRVPCAWRGGVLKVKCRASGHRKIVGAWRDPIDESRAFVVPIYVEGDDQARQAAEDFVRSEQGLRQNWRRHQGRNEPTVGSLLGLVARPSLPPEWAHHLIQSGGDDYLDRYRSRLTLELAEAADKFVIARRELFEFSR